MAASGPGLVILQLNCNGLRARTTELARRLAVQKPHVVALQETCLPPDLPVPMEILKLGYNVACRSDAPVSCSSPLGPPDLGSPLPMSPLGLTDAGLLPAPARDPDPRPPPASASPVARPPSSRRTTTTTTKPPRMQTCKGRSAPSWCDGCRKKQSCTDKLPAGGAAPRPAPDRRRASPPPPAVALSPPSVDGPFLPREERRERPRGGVIILVRNDTSYDKTDPPYHPVHDEATYVSAALIHSPAGSTTTIVNIYSPPARRSAGQGTQVQSIEIAKLTPPPGSILLGDLNAHAATWDPHQPESELGHAIEEWVTEHGLIVLSDGAHTRINPATGGLSVPDLTVATPDIAVRATWSTGRNLGSDHLPIITTIPAGPTPSRCGPGKFLLP